MPSSLEDYASELEYKLVRATQSSVKILLLRSDGHILYKSSTLQDSTVKALSSLISVNDASFAPGSATLPQFIPSISDDKFFIYRATQYLYIVVFSTGSGILEAHKRIDILDKYGKKISENFVAPPKHIAPVTVVVERKKEPKKELSPEIIEAIKEELISVKATIKMLTEIASKIYDHIDNIFGKA
ncbi:MAG: hypothetical protein QXL15_03240 [Candidatus Korarchaeota archaeon]